MTEKEVRELAKTLMDKHGITHAGYLFKFNNRKRSVGLCVKFFEPRWIDGKMSVGTIELQRTFALTATVEDVIDTILHEIAHAIAGLEHGHNETWKAVARRIGCSPKACSAVSSEPLSGEKPTGEKAYAICPSCYRRYNWFRMPNLSAKYHCPHCGRERGRLTVRVVSEKPTETGNRYLTEIKTKKLF